MTQGVGCCFIQEHVYAPVTGTDQGENCFLRDTNFLLAIFVLRVFWRQENVRINPLTRTREAT